MGLTGGFFNAVTTSGGPDRTYTAEDMNNILDGLVSDGICDWGSNFDFQKDFTNPNRPKIGSGRGKLAKHWFINDETVLDALVNNTSSTKYYAICVECNLSDRTMMFKYKPGNLGGNTIPDIHADDNETIKTCGLWMVTLPANTSLSQVSDSAWYSLIGKAPEGYEKPDNFTPYVTYLGTIPDPDLTDYLKKTGGVMTGTLTSRDIIVGSSSNESKIRFSANSGIESVSGQDTVKISNVRNPINPGDAVPLEWGNNHFLPLNEYDIFTSHHPIIVSLPSSSDSSFAISFENASTEGRGIEGSVNPVGNGRLRITGVRNPEDPTDATPKKYVDGIVTYSSEETVCGYWIHGEPIYRKAYELSIPGASGTRLFTVDDIGEKVYITNMYGTIKETSLGAQGSDFYPLPFKQTKTSSGTSIDREVIPHGPPTGLFQLNVTWNSESTLVGYVVYEYLKPV